MEKPKAFELTEHKLGIASWAIQSIFQQGKDSFKLAKEQSDIEKATRAIVLISSDCYTAWNARRQLVMQKHLNIRDELKFSALIFTKSPKSIDTWAYRKWLTLKQGSDQPDTFYDAELKLCHRLAELSPRNYHAWAYRQWILHRSPLKFVRYYCTCITAWNIFHICSLRKN